jgi:hypothetical protein
MRGPLGFVRLTISKDITMINKSLLLASIALCLSVASVNAQTFSEGTQYTFTGAGGAQVDNIETVGNVVYAANFDGGSNTVTINGVSFTGTNQVDGTYQGGNFTITGGGGLDGTGGGTGTNGSDNNASTASQLLNENGIYYQLTLTLDDLTPGKEYAVQLLFDAQTGDNRSQQYDDITNPNNVVASSVVYAGGNTTAAGTPNLPPFITDTFVASGTSEVLQAQYGQGAGAQLSGFVLETAPEPSTWALMGLSLVGLAYLVRRPLARS